jgi:taurine transport system permease protein
MTILIAYIAIFAAAFFIVHFFTLRIVHRNDFTSLKTVTFGDESAVKANRIASVISVLAVFFIWGAFTGSKLTPIHVPGPYMGTTEFTYTAENAAGETDSATVTVVVHKLGEDVELPEPAPSSGFAQNDVDSVAAWRSGLIRVNRNDEGREDEGFKITAIDGQPIAVGSPVSVADGSVALTAKGSLNFTPDKGMQMEPIWLPSPEAVWHRYVEIFGDGYQGITLLDHLGWSLLRVCAGFLLGSLIGIPLGYAMGLSGWFRGWFDPIVEFMRPVPPLASDPAGDHLVRDRRIRQDYPPVSCRTLDHDHCCPRRGVGRQYIQGSCCLFPRSVQIADPVARDRAQFIARDFHRCTGRDGCLLGDGGCC